ncbi:dihydroxyacetone kinase subunit DhaK [Jannaschia aquimarina]|uniref:DhaK_2 protein n=1 Tax=Jannaschia aquimarina TaxID=935700 RepID=A0A0D1EDK1_9RHOB|nr:dihydroxyacetone kinase subunit DhaK [Jannaschia aquimarina]KIT15021.1 Dihydroxyacetone kinase [Jannaschia aquimarina]SNS62127.1 dihydroxyacetone kinase [Jannaschia aquimarina]
MQFINAKADLVTEALDGLVASSGGTLGRLDGYPHIKVAIRADWDRSRVALVSGGGSGHEPAHAGFVGPGMLTAAVCGEVFASPSVEAVLAGILAVTGEAGCLLIVKNYTGDRLNFGLAAERARALGKQVEMVVVDDDVALPDLPQPRGVAGTLFVHKIAGAMAERGDDLATIASAARDLIPRIASIGKSLSTCTVPGSAREDRIPPGKAELGLRIHGEPGVEQIDFEGADEAVATMAARLPESDADRVVLVNDLGSTTPLELSVLTRAVHRAGIAGRIIGPARLMTSLDMHGVSLSVLDLKEGEAELLAAAVPMAAWPGMQTLAEPQIRLLPDGLTPIAPIPSENPRVRGVIEDVCALLIAAESDLNALDAKSGDGDTGSTLATAARALRDALDRMPLADLTQLFPALGNEVSQTMGGSSGVILAIFFNAAGDASASGANARMALRAGLDRVGQVGGAQLGDRTMIDALAPALDALPQGIDAAAQAAREGADATASIHRAKAGRAAYVPETNLAGHKDPGAEAVARVFEGLARALA